MNVDARDFNRAAEKFYREQLRQQNLSEACAHLRQDADSLQRCERERSPRLLAPRGARPGRKPIRGRYRGSYLVRSTLTAGDNRL